MYLHQVNQKWACWELNLLQISFAESTVCYLSYWFYTYATIAGKTMNFSVMNLAKTTLKIINLKQKNAYGEKIKSCVVN